MTLFADVPGTPTYSTSDLLRLAAWLGPLLATLVLLFAWFVWPLLGLSLFV